MYRTKIDLSIIIRSNAYFVDSILFSLKYYPTNLTFRIGISTKYHRDNPKHSIEHSQTTFDFAKEQATFERRQPNAEAVNLLTPDCCYHDSTNSWSVAAPRGFGFGHSIFPARPLARTTNQPVEEKRRRKSSILDQKRTTIPLRRVCKWTKPTRIANKEHWQ